MGRVKRTYGPWSRHMLEALRAHEVLKVEAFVYWLGERGIDIDRTLVSHWSAGRSHLPADLLPLLAEFTGRSDLVFAEYLRAVDCEVVAIPTGTPGGGEIADQMLEVGATLGRLHRAVIDVRLPDSPGGESVTPEERAELRDQLSALIQQLSDLKARLDYDDSHEPRYGRSTRR